MRACPVPPCRLCSQLANHSSDFPHSFCLSSPCSSSHVHRARSSLPSGHCGGNSHGIGILLDRTGEINFSFSLFSSLPHPPGPPPCAPLHRFSAPFRISPTDFCLSRCLSTVSERIEGKWGRKKKMRMIILSWHFLGFFSALWGLAAGAFPSSVQIGELEAFYARTLLTDPTHRTEY